MKSFIKNIISTIIAITAVFFFIIILFAVLVFTMSSEKEVTIKNNSILKIDLANTSVVERTSESPFEFDFSGNVKETIELKTVLDNIEKAKTDENIKGIYINTSFVDAGLSQTRYNM